MVAATTQVHALKTAIVEALALRAGLAGVQITSADVGGDRAAHEYIALIGEDLIDQEWASIGRLSRDETITLTGAIYVRKPGKGETVIREARARCIALMAEIEAVFTGTDGDPSVGNVVRSCRARPAELAELATPEGRVALLRFEIQSGPSRLRAE